VAPAPAIDIEKYVSVDGGTTWQDADTPTGPTAPFPGTVHFKVVVTNTGNVPLTSVVVTDTDFSFAGVVGTLAVGASDESDVLPVASILGQHANLATVNALYESTPVTDNDPAHYFGGAPGIDIEKLVSDDGGTTWDDADDPFGPFIMEGDPVTWQYVVTNTGTVPLTDVAVIDDNGTPLDDTDDFSPTYVSGDTNGNGELDTDETWIYEWSGTAVGGQYTNDACVVGYYAAAPVTDCDPSNYYGVVCYSETAFGLNNQLSPECFDDLGFNNWGWTHGPLLYSRIYTFELWAGAAHCDTSNGTYAGTVTIDYTGTGADITYNLEPDFEIVEEHVYIGRTELPQQKKGKNTTSTVAPGQYYITNGLTGDIYIIYHAVVQWCDYPDQT